MNVDTTLPHRGVPQRPTPSRGGQALEVLLFIVLFFPVTALAVLATGGRGAAEQSFVHTALALILRNVTLVAIVLCFIGRRREPLAAIGWRGRRWGAEVLLGFVLYGVMLVIIAVAEIVLARAGVTGPSEMPKGFMPTAGGGQLVLATALVVVVAIAEETVFRGYLLHRMISITRSTVAAVVITSFLFALGHGYEGPLGMIVVGLIGVVLSIVVLWRGSLVAAMVMHFCQDFLGLVVAPALRGHALWPFSP